MSSVLSLFDWSADRNQLALFAETPVVKAAPTRLSYLLAVAGGRNLSPTWKERAADNLAAMRLAAELAANPDRFATADELALLARYVGFGATDLAKNLFPVPGQAVARGWEELHAALHQLVGDTDRATLARSTQYAHFTPDYLSVAIFDAIARLGFVGGRALEPGCGIGLFMAAAPEALASAIKWIGIEMDATAASIARILQPRAEILTEDFTSTRVRYPVDLVIGNPPFSQTQIVGEGHAGRMRLRLHDYFIARSLEMLKPGGLAAFVSSHGTFDKQDQRARGYISELADLIGAIRLPQGSMNAQAGTEVVVDVMFFRRRHAGAAPNGANWLDVVQIEPVNGPCEKPLFVNRYYIEHPEMVLGNHAWRTSPVGPAYTCRGDLANIDDAVNAALDHLPGIAMRGSEIVAAAEAVLPVAEPAPAPVATTTPELRLVESPKAEPVSAALLTQAEIDLDRDAYVLKDGSYDIERGVLKQCVDGIIVDVPVRSGRGTEGTPAKNARIIAAFVLVRNALRAVITAQVQDNHISNVDAQTRLGKAYDAFVAEFGPINLTRTIVSKDSKTGEERETEKRPNIKPLSDDPDCWLVASIERYEPETGVATKGTIFTERVISAPRQRTIHSTDDALAAVLDECGRVDLKAIAQLRETTVDAVIAELGDRIYALPEEPDTWVMADEYLSGPVRRKLAAAKAALEQHPRWQRNITALEAAQPPDLNPSDITARLGSPWIPADDVEQFVGEVLGVKTAIAHTPLVAAWDVDLYPFKVEASATSEWGTQRRHAGELIHDALNGHEPQVYDIVENAAGNDTRVLNPVETEAAREKLNRIQEAFASWLWADTDRAFRLMRVYNDRYNDLAPREFDGSHLQLRGAAASVNLYEHQKRAIWRIITAGGTYIAHAVGAGKTKTIASAVMEQRRLGFVSKPMLVVPSHCLVQFTLEWLQQYPTAQLLVADEQNFASDKRHRFIARATTGNWDCIIITHSAFKLIPTPTQFERRMVQDLIDEFECALVALKANSGNNDRTTRKRLEQRKEALHMRLEALKSRKDNMVTIEEIGIDQVIVDEAHEFRKLTFSTNAGNIKGIDPDGSQRAWDLYVKSRFIETINPKRALILASGTPITNTLGELYTAMRYMAEDSLRERDIHEFDAWRAIFGETVTELELQPSGQYKPVTRFAQFCNVPELVALFRSFADIVQKQDLRSNIKLPVLAGGNREILTGEATVGFKSYQQVLGQRIVAIEKRSGKPEKGDDIILSVINDGRHAAIDVRLVDREAESEYENKLNLMIRNVFEIHQKTSESRYLDIDGSVHAIPGGTQMIFSDLGTPSIAEKRGFSAYEWIRSELIRMGVPAKEIAFMQDYKKTAQKQVLFNAMNSGRVRILIGSTQTMGTGVNAQRRLKALHHLDVPWLPSDIEQREGRIERQGNQNDEIELYGYATPGSMDAAMWQALERKARFIAAAMSGDRTIRRLEDASAQANSFAIAKAIASGNPMVMERAALDTEVSRLKRLRSAHFDDQFRLQRTVRESKSIIAHMETEIEGWHAAKLRAKSTKGDAFTITIGTRRTDERTDAGQLLLGRAGTLPREGHAVLGSLGGFDVVGRTLRAWGEQIAIEYGIDFGCRITWTEIEKQQSPIGLVQRLENMVQHIDKWIRSCEEELEHAKRQLAFAEPRIGLPFEQDAELAEKSMRLAEIDRALFEESERQRKLLEEQYSAQHAAAAAEANETGAATDDDASNSEDDVENGFVTDESDTELDDDVCAA